MFIANASSDSLAGRMIRVCLFLVMSTAIPEYLRSESRETLRYVDADRGDDGNSGETPEAAWKTLNRVNSSRLEGATVLFRRGAVFRGTLVIGINRYAQTNGNRYAAYGTGAKPILIASVDRSQPTDWRKSGSKLWRSSEAVERDVGNILFVHGNKVNVGFRKWRESDLSTVNSFWFDLESKRRTGKGHILIRSENNPGDETGKVRIEVALNLPNIYVENAQKIEISDLDLRYAGAHGVAASECREVLIRNCDISWSGGGNQNENVPNSRHVRYGNGIQFMGNASDIRVEGCRIWNIYDTGVTAQNRSGDVIQKNIRFADNTIWNCGMSSVELWIEPSKSIMRDVEFVNNTCYRAGYGWGTQRPDRVGVHVMTWWGTGSGTIENIRLENNIFHTASQAMILTNQHWTTANLTSQNNCFYDPNRPLLFVARGDQRYSGDLEKYQRDTGWEHGSINSDPRLADPENGSFDLQDGSPCIEKGIGVRSSR